MLRDQNRDAPVDDPPDQDIQIVFTGLRPGEKLYEERLMDEEGLQTTKNELISIGQPIPFDEDVFLEQLQKLAKNMRRCFL